MRSSFSSSWILRGLAVAAFAIGFDRAAAAATACTTSANCSGTTPVCNFPVLLNPGVCQGCDNDLDCVAATGRAYCVTTGATAGACVTSLDAGVSVVDAGGADAGNADGGGDGSDGDTTGGTTGGTGDVGDAGQNDIGDASSEADGGKRTDAGSAVDGSTAETDGEAGGGGACSVVAPGASSVWGAPALALLAGAAWLVSGRRRARNQRGR